MRQVAAIALQSSVHGAVGFAVELGNCALTTICDPLRFAVHLAGARVHEEPTQAFVCRTVMAMG